MSRASEYAEEVQEHCGIRTLSRMGEGDAVKVLQALGRGELDARHAEAVLHTQPRFLVLAERAITTLVEVAQQAGESQREAMRDLVRPMEQILEGLLHLARQAETDETRQEIAQCLVQAGEQYQKIALTLERMNKENNSFWREVGLLLMAIVAAFGGAAYAMNRDDEES